MNRKLMTLSNLSAQIKVFSLLLAFVLFSLPQQSIASPVDVQQARTIARAFMQRQGMKVPAQPNRMPALGTPKAVAQPAYYIFNAAAGNGFVIVSGDDATEQILGYATQGTYEEQEVPENVSSWLDYYQEAVEAVQRHSVKSVAEATSVESHAEVAPLLATNWNQGDPYNGKCPTYNGTLCYTGCVATAMAQVMNYHRWPEKSTTTIPSYKTNVQMGTLAALPAATFNWAAMQGSGSGFNDAVATLMEYCGYAVKMNYGTGASSASSAMIAPALKNYFGYDDDTRLASRSRYTIAQWDALIYGEVSNSRPVIYSGQSMGGGHEFVVDGYKDGLYHVNWGWSGRYDGYFRLTVMNPMGNDGIGATTTGDGYAMRQDAVVGIHPDDDTKTDFTEYPFTTAFTCDNGYLKTDYTNHGSATMNFYMGLRIQGEDGSVKDVQVHNSVYSLPVNKAVFNGLDITSQLSGLAAGTYTLLPLAKLSGSNEWVRTSKDDLYITLVVGADGSRTYTMHPVENLSLQDMSTTSDLQVGHLQDLKFTLKNEGDEFDGVVNLFLTQDESNLGDPVSYTGFALESGSEDELHFYITPSSVGTWHCILATDAEGTKRIGSRDIVFTSAQTQQAHLEFYKTPSVSVSSNQFKVTCYVENKGTEDYSRGLVYKITEKDSGTEKGTGTISSAISPNSIICWTTTGSNYDNSKVYVFSVYYYPDPQTNDMALVGSVDIIMPQASGILRVEDRPSDDGQLYDLQGRRINKPAKTGIYIRNKKKVIIAN